MKNYSKYILYFFGIWASVVWISCAKPRAPQGGPKDKTPPKIDSLKSTPNRSLNFSDKEIVLAFDEWIKLDNISTKAIVSPPLKEKLKTKLRGKKLIIDLSEETLKENTTYTINLGDAIKDITEGNADKNFSFVFSTGAYIDSLIVQGIVIDAFTNAPKEDALVMLYDDLSDSVIYKEKPFYFAKTDKAGRFSIKNIKKGEFKMIALEDGDNNYLFNLPNEHIAYLDSTFVLEEGANNSFKLQLFEEAQSLKRLSKDMAGYGLIKLTFNQDIEKEKIDIQTTINEFDIYQEQDKDTLKFWFIDDEASELTLILNDGKELKDTIVLPNSKDTRPTVLTLRKNPAAFKPEDQKDSTKLVKHRPFGVPPSKPIRIEANSPLRVVDATKIQMLEDSVAVTGTIKTNIDEKNARFFTIDYDWKEGKRYDFHLSQGALTDLFGASNEDIFLAYRVVEVKLLGTVNATINGMDSTQNYIVQLFQNKTLIETRAIPFGQKTWLGKFELLFPKEYSIRLIEDKNKNGEWDSGQYPNRQPERLINSNAAKLRPNWELELTIDGEL